MEQNREKSLEQWKASCVHCKDGKCVTLIDSPCAAGKTQCSFHLTAEQKAESEKKWRDRMCSLSTHEQQYYADKYYKGKPVWNGA